MRTKSTGHLFKRLIFIVAVFWLWTLSVSESVNGETYIQDRTGEKWNVSQAESIGFRPEKFQYGIGRHAFTPLEDSDLEPATSSIWKSSRVIGIVEGKEVHAYSVSKLSRHEIANTTLNLKPIVVGY